MKRALVVGGCLAILAADGAAWSTAFARGDVITARLQFYPERMIGEHVTLSLVKVSAVHPHSFTVRQGGFTYTILGDPGELVVGEECYVRGEFVDVATVQQAWHERAPERGGKKLLGFLGLAIAAGVTLAGTRWTTDGVRLRG